MSSSQIGRDTTFTYIGHATTLIVSPGGKRILLDPWTKGNPVCPDKFKPVEALGVVDLILITHIHNDHVGDAADIIKANTVALTVCVPEAAAWLQSKGCTNFHTMNIGGSFSPHNAPGIVISMTQAFHTSSFTEEDGTVVQGGLPAGFIIELENGFTIYAAGDTGLFGDMALIKDVYEPDLALLPIGDNYTMGPRTAAIAAKLLGVDFVIPIHHTTFPVLTGTPQQFTECMADQPDVTVIMMAPGEFVN